MGNGAQEGLSTIWNSLPAAQAEPGKEPGGMQPDKLGEYTCQRMVAPENSRGSIRIKIRSY